MSPDEFLQETRSRILGPQPTLLDWVNQCASWATEIVRPFADGPYTPTPVAGKPEDRIESFDVLDFGAGYACYRLVDAPPEALDCVKLLQCARVARIQIEGPTEQLVLMAQVQQIGKLVERVASVRPLEGQIAKYSSAQGARRRGKTGVTDEMLFATDKLIRSGKAKNVTSAARMVAGDPELNPQMVNWDTLARKYRKKFLGKSGVLP